MDKKKFSLGSIFSKFFSSTKDSNQVDSLPKNNSIQLNSEEQLSNKINSALKALDNIHANKNKSPNNKVVSSTPIPSLPKKKATDTTTTDDDDLGSFAGFFDKEKILSNETLQVPEPEGVADDDFVFVNKKLPIPEPSGVSDDDEINNETFKKLPPALGQPYIPPSRLDNEQPKAPPALGQPYIEKKKTENTDDSGESMDHEIKLPSIGQVSERILKQQRRIAAMEAMEAQRLSDAHSRKGPYMSR